MSEVVQYVEPGHFITLLLPEHQDYDEMAHEVRVVVTDLVEREDQSTGLYDEARVPRHGGVVCVTAGRGVSYKALNEALIRVADRYRVPAIFWSHGWLHAAEAPQHAGLDES